jgi:hypothetical protein
MTGAAVLARRGLAEAEADLRRAFRQWRRGAVAACIQAVSVLPPDALEEF